MKRYKKLFETKLFSTAQDFLISNKKGDTLIIPNKRWKSRDVEFNIKNMGDGKYKIDYIQFNKKIGTENFRKKGIEALLLIDYRQREIDYISKYNVDIKKYVSNYYKMSSGKEYFIIRLVSEPKVYAYLKDNGEYIGSLTWDKSLTSDAEQKGHKDLLVIWGISIEAIQVDSKYRSQGVGENLIKFAMFSTDKSRIKVIGPQTGLGQALFKKFGAESDK